jgi:hypothetical protein
VGAHRGAGDHAVALLGETPDGLDAAPVIGRHLQVELEQVTAILDARHLERDLAAGVVGEPMLGAPRPPASPATARSTGSHA